MKNTFFHPHIGSLYGTPGSIFDKRILIVGNSHYCKHGCPQCGDTPLASDCHSFTTDMVDEYLNSEERKRWMATYSKFINTFFPSGASQEQKELLLSSVAFYNYLQVAAGDNPYATRHYNFHDEKHFQSFLEVLELTSPDVVISWGPAVWDAIPNDWGFGVAKMIEFDFPSLYEYQYADKVISMIGVYHPSSSSYDQSTYRQFFGRFIQTK